MVFLAAIFILDRGPQISIGFGEGILLGKHGDIRSKKGIGNRL
jgi:hypothetical protein